MDNPFEMYYNWLLYGEFVKFGTYLNIWLNQIGLV